jgi:hypothetical protein
MGVYAAFFVGFFVAFSVFAIAVIICFLFLIKAWVDNEERQKGGFK